MVCKSDKEKVKKIVFLTSKELKETFQKNLITPSYIAEDINSLDFDFSKIEFITSKKDLNEGKINLTVFWNKTDKILYSMYNKFYPYLINGDTFNNQFEANQMMKLSNLFLTKEIKKKNNSLLKETLIKVKNKKNDILLIGSGPSTNLINELNINYDNTLSIICNSVIKNKELLKKINPTIMVASDAVFHSGYSKYACDFREALIEGLDLIKDMIFIVPSRDFHLYTKNLPIRFKNRIFAIESKKKKKFNINITKELYLKSTSNVLTLMMLPIAASLSDNIKLLGFDGKTKEDKNIFWKYDEKSQFINTLETTKLAHPAFYKVNYDKYYNIHCDQVKELIDLITYNKIKISNLSHSNIPALESIFNG